MIGSVILYSTYVLPSRTDDDCYTGCTGDLRKRRPEHKTSRVRSRAYRVPLERVDYQACSPRDDAFRRKRFLKSGKVKSSRGSDSLLFLDVVGHNKLEWH
jgi:predicted GIY-YIG superfamily endonuclease